MAENLKTTKLNDGTEIPLVIDTVDWANLKTPGYSYYNNNGDKYKDNYGALYNWYTVNTGKLCPTGWHVPSDMEWDTLTTFLRIDSLTNELRPDTIGGILKETGITHWFSPNSNATNETGFTALPGGCRGHNGKFGIVGADCFWWSATEDNLTYSWYRYLTYDSKSIIRGSYFKNDGFSVRCVKDLN